MNAAPMEVTPERALISGETSGISNIGQKNPTNSEHSRVNEIDLLRFVAAIAVVLFHYSFRGAAADGLSVMSYTPLSGTFKYGYLGVNLFFMISGFAILMSATGATPQAFVASRIARLYPTFWVACTLTFVLISVWQVPGIHVTLLQYLGNMTMLGAFLGLPSVDGAYWSLYVELRFYLLVVIAILFRQMKNVEPLLVAWFILSVCLEFYPSSTLRQLFIVDYAAYFIAGSACFLLWRDGPTFLRLALLVGSFVLALCEANHVVDEFEVHYQTLTSYAITDSIIGSFFIAMYLIAMRWTGSLGQQTWFIAGASTYPFYLIHQNIGYLVFNTFSGRVNTHVLFWGTFALMLTASYFIFIFVDRPLRPRLRDATNRLLRKVTTPWGRQVETTSK